MLPPLKPGVRLSRYDGPTIETERLMLRPWRAADIEPNTAMLSDPALGALHHRRWQAGHRPFVGWRNAAIMAGHWVLHGFGMFVVEEKSSGKYIGRVGPWFPPGWPGFEVGWGIATGFRGKGYAVEAARAAIDWVFATFELDGSSIASTGRTRPRRPSRGGSAREGRGDRSVRPCRRCLGDVAAANGAASRQGIRSGALTAAPTASPARRGRIAPATGSRPPADRRARSAPGGPASGISAPSPARPGTNSARRRDRD